MADGFSTLFDNRILVVDDSAVDGDVLLRLLLKAGWSRDKLTCTESGQTALEQCRTDPPDCLLLDYRLPDVDGLTFLRELAGSLGRHQPAIVIVTGQGSERTAVEAMKLGAHDYVVKSTLTAERLSQAISDARRRRRLEQGSRERLENLSTFVNAVVHDLRRPLTSLGLNVDLCRMCVEDKDQEGFMVSFDGVSESYEQLRDMLESLHRLVLTEGSAFEGSVLDLAVPVHDAIRLLQPALRAEGFDVQVDTLPTVISDKEVVSEVIQNIVDNAISYGKGTRPVIEIRAAIDKRDAAKPLAGLVIIDHGQGLDPQTIENMFEPLWRAPANSRSKQSVVSNSGLGLAISERLMDRLGGKIVADNSPTGGARFFVLFSTFVEDSIDNIRSAISVMDTQS